MKSTAFVLDYKDSKTIYTQNRELHEYVFEVPLAPAYAIEYFTLHVGSLSAYPSERDSLIGNKLTLSLSYELDDEDSCYVTIFYHAIRDYKLLFPNVSIPDLQERLGCFYMEAEKSFDSALWLSFALMCGALFEGILFHKLGCVNKSFNDLTVLAKSSRVIDLKTADTIDEVRKFRNLVHSNRYNSRYVTRTEAMDIRVVLDKLIRSI